MTEPVLNKLRENGICLVRVPPNMTDLYQPLDLTVNGAAKAFMKWKYTEWYSGGDCQSLGRRQGTGWHNVEAIHFKALELYDYLTWGKGRSMIANGWKAAGITEAVEGGSQKLESLDPFAVLDRLENSSMMPTHKMEPENVAEIDASTVESFVTHSIGDDDNEEWEMEEHPI